MRKLRMKQVIQGGLKKEDDNKPLEFKVFYIMNITLLFLFCLLYWLAAIFNFEFMTGSSDKETDFAFVLVT